MTRPQTSEKVTKLGLFSIALTIVLVEGIIHFAVEMIPELHPATRSLLDAIVLAVVGTGMVYSIILKPQVAGNLKLTEVLIESMSEGFVFQDRTGQILEHNRAAADVLGLPGDQLLERDSFDHRWQSIREDGTPFPPAQHPAMEVLRTGKPALGIIMGIVRPDQQRRWILINSVPLKLDPVSPLVTHSMTTFADITDNHQMKQDLTLTRDRLRFAIQAVRFGVWDWDLKNSVLIWDEFMYELFEIDPKDFSGDYDAFEKTLYHEDRDLVQSDLARTFESKSPLFKSEFRVITKAGNLKHIAATAQVFYDSDQKPARLVGNNWDVTDRHEKQKILQDQQIRLVQSAKMASLGQMAGGVAHEINNPLSIIRGKTAQLIRLTESTPNLPAPFKDGLDRIIETTDRIAKIVKGMRSLSREGDQDPFERISLGEVLEDALSLCTERFRKRGIDLRMAPIPEIHIMGRPVQLAQIFLNLLNNAHDAIENEMEKWIQIEVTDLDQQTVQISITDSGPPIPADVRSKIMTPFFTTKGTGKGTGLGLSISRSIIQSHQGEILLDPSFHHTRFLVTLKKHVNLGPTKNERAES